MNRKLKLSLVLSVVFIGMLAMVFNLRETDAIGTIFIRDDGSIDPEEAPILRVDDLYTLTGNITSEFDGIVIERNNLILNGNGFTICGSGVWNSKGIYISGRNNVTIEKVRIRNFTYGILGSYTSNCTISDNIITGNTYGIQLEFFSRFNNIADNNFENHTYGIVIMGAYNNTIEMNSFLKESKHSILLLSSHHNKILQNEINASERWLMYSSIHLEQSSGNNIKGNNITDNNWYGIGLDRSSQNNITENNIERNTGGIGLSEASYNNISNNSIKNNGSPAISLNQDSHFNNITYNKLEYNTDGIKIRFSSANTISHNEIRHSQNGVGISITDFSDQNLVSWNEIAYNKYGVIIGYSGNKFFRNNFIENTNQTLISQGTPNIWNHSLPEGGNFWSDYLERYPNASEQDGSGVWDIPYVIDKDNIDYYPLIPEFPSAIILPLFMTLTLLAAILYRRKRAKSSKAEI